MKVLIFGDNMQDIMPLVKEIGFQITEKNPDAILSYGGDGTLMHAEYAFPGIPKLLLRGSKICKRCSALSNEEVLKRYAAGTYTIQKRMKLEVSVNLVAQYGINDIAVHNKDHRHAMRYRLWVNNRSIVSAHDEIIGDGIIIATPFGSTGYYRSITDSFFEIGIGLAFNNSTEQVDHVVLSDESEIKLKIVRGPAIVYTDNQEKTSTLSEGDEVIVRKARDEMQLITVL